MQFKAPGDPETYDLVTKMTWAEAEAFETAVGLTAARVGQMDAVDRPAIATRVSIWISMKRKRPTLKLVELEGMVFQDFEFIAESDSDKEAMANAEQGDGDGVPAVGPTNPALDNPEPPAAPGVQSSVSGT